ncbi:hypothetical protein, partial [Pseudomonas aeruginosa]
SILSAVLEGAGMISEEEFRELQEELAELTESFGRLEEMNEALSEVVFALLQSTSIRPRLFSRLIDHTLDKWLILRRDLGSPSAKLLQRVRDDVLSKPPEGTLDFPSARPRPLLRAVPAPHRKDSARGRDGSEGDVQHGPRPGDTPQPAPGPTPHEPSDEQRPELDE